jgi:ABC-2 type transport system permease protein
MSPSATLAIAARVLIQLRRDPRTVALLVVVPCVLMVILRYAFDGEPRVFARIAPPLIGLLPFITMFIVTSIAMLRERTSGTLERLMSMPVAKLDLLAGYALAFGAVAVVQTAVLAAVTLGPLGADAERSAALLLALALANALLGMSLGLLASAFATTEFQAVQFMPAIVLPQLLLCGLFVARDAMAGWLEALSAALPLTYAYDALARAGAPAPLGARFAIDVAVVVVVTLGALALGAASMRRRSG